ncbi:MAG: efflux RND transporter permease subunit [Gemmataceae bacterium]|nr:efflux RND transporter permease subunit [Gemmataceae bacterium]MDW8265771.1 efflux RND transporter permease subunit [Gemmataceae bacterium]
MRADDARWSLSDLSIKNPVFAVMLSAAMIVFGWLGYRDMGVSQFPEIDFPVVSVVITREAASPEVMDGDVSDVVEDAIAGVEGVDYIMSHSLEGTSIVTVYFHLSRNIDVAMQDVQNAVAAARRRLPIDIDPPVISKVNPNNLPVMWLTLSGSVPLNKISDYAEKEFKQQIVSISNDIGGVQFAGLQSRNIRIWVDAEKLTAYNLGAEDVLATIQKQHAELPAGYIKSDLIEFNLRIMGEAYSLPEFRKLIVAQRNGQPIHLEDVAVIEDGLEDRRSLARYNRLPAVAVGVRKAVGGNLVAVCEAVKAKLPELRRRLPPGIELHVPVDYSLFVRENVEELKLTLFLGIVLTALVCYLFLGSIGTTINICLSIPTSLIGTFFVTNYGMKLLGLPPFTINLMTLLGLSLSVGVVVDDAILVLENIYRHREAGEDRRQAALRGAREITFAALAATLSIMAIFVPVAFMTGTIGRFFFQFGVTVSVAVFLSLLCALTLTPMLCSYFLNVRLVTVAEAGVVLHEKPPRPAPFRWALAGVVAAALLVLLSGLRLAAWAYPALGPWAWPVLSLAGGPQAVGQPLVRWLSESLTEAAAALVLVRYGPIGWWAADRFVLEPFLIRPTEWVLQRLTNGYGRLLAWSLRHWVTVLAGGAALIAVAAGMLAFDVLGRELVPSEDQSRFVIHVVGPVGSSIDQMDQLLQECEDVLVRRPDVAGILSTVATESGQLMNEADIFVHLVPQRQRPLKQQQIMQQVRAELEEIRDIRVVVRDQSTEGFTAQRGDPVDFAIQGDWQRLPALADEIMKRMRASGLVLDVDSDYRPGMPEVQIIPHREKLALVGVPVGRLADSMALLVGGQRVGKYTDRGRRYDIRVRLRLQQRSSPDDLSPLNLRTQDGRLVPLSDVASYVTRATLPIINRYNHQRKIEITASPAPGVSQGEAIAACRAIAAAVLPEEGFQLIEMGNAQAMHETMQSLVFALVLGVVVAYMILGVQFNSFLHPLTVLMAMPFAITGALVTLWLTGDTLNMMSMIGLVLLMGLVKKNSIILVDYTNQLRAEGREVREAVLAACPVRLRPILMTSVATVAGAVPAALGLGPGAETRAPMARAIIGGIVLSTLVTLLLVPVFYVLLERLRAAAPLLLRRDDDGG